MKAIFLYDGDCSFCHNLAYYWKEKTDSKEIEFQSFRNLKPDELVNLHPSLTKAKCESDVQLIYAGQRLPGFFAVRRMMFWSKGFKWMAPLLYLPFVPYVGMLVMFILKSKKTNH